MMLKINPHILPDEDTKKHITGGNARCWCRPRIEDGYIVHYAEWERSGMWDKALQEAKRGAGYEDLMVKYRLTKQEAWNMVMGKRT